MFWTEACRRQCRELRRVPGRRCMLSLLVNFVLVLEQIFSVCQLCVITVNIASEQLFSVCLSVFVCPYFYDGVLHIFPCDGVLHISVVSTPYLSNVECEVTTTEYCYCKQYCLCTNFLFSQ
jgi:hypothetical protein